MLSFRKDIAISTMNSVAVVTYKRSNQLNVQHHKEGDPEASRPSEELWAVDG